MPLTCQVFDAPNDRFEAVAREAIKLTNEWLPCETEIRVVIRFAEMHRDSLGTCLAPFDYRIRNQTYPSATAKAIINDDFNSPEADIYVVINSANQDELCTDMEIEEIPRRQYDLLSVILHEVQHGLLQCISSGITTIFKVPVMFGRGRWESFLAFLTTDGRYCSLRKLRGRPFAMHTALTSGKLVFHTSERMIAELHASGPFVKGRTADHLDHATYIKTEDRLMTPFLALCQKKRTFGPVLREIHSALRDPNEPGAPVLRGWVSPASEHRNGGPRSCLSNIRRLSRQEPAVVLRKPTAVPEGIFGVDYKSL